MTTHNGRGQDGTSGSAGDALPASTTPYEGVVLPANGDPWTPQQQRQAQSEREQVRPPAGQPWGGPWGPGAEAAQTDDSTYGGYGGAQQDGTGHGGTGHGGTGHGGPGHGGTGQGSPGYWGAPQQDEPGGALPLPPEGTPARPRTPPSAPSTSPHLPQPQSPGGAGPLPPAAGQGGPGTPGEMPQPAYGQSLPGAMPPPPSAPPPSAPSAPPTPPQGAYQGGPGDSDATQMLPPFPAGQPAAGSVGPDDGTQLLPPQQPGPAAPVGGSPDSEATQYLPPMAAGVGGDSEATQMLPPMSGAGTPGAGTPDTQGQGTGAEGTRQPLPEFENLFRSDAPQSGRGQPAAGNGEPGSTQSLPVFDDAAQRQAPPRGGYGYPQPGSQGGGYGYPQPGTQGGGYGYPQPGSQGGGYGYPQPGSRQYEPQAGGRAARRDAGRGRRGMHPGVLIGAGLAGVAVIGLVVGLLLANGGDDDPGSDKPKASSEPAGEKKSSAAPDPAEAQAKKLDALLADSNNSRSAVIRSVQNIRACKSLGKAAADLRSAAKQRNALVRRLGELKTDAIPHSAQLNSALKSAWRSSASADSHYAAWADQVARKKGCHKGKAKTTRHLAAGNGASGKATASKKKAARLWNPTAKKYGLDERQYGSL
ncbi:hypothetical protein ACIGW3_20320 [Streptomyces sp. NPDC053499]|uniref:hypothetical protein n=1 Tax=Streptomyces sp. NPDC053499 TaxID=3365707 RepID=UPI0037D5CA20